MKNSGFSLVEKGTSTAFFPADFCWTCSVRVQSQDCWALALELRVYQSYPMGVASCVDAKP